MASLRALMCSLTISMNLIRNCKSWFILSISTILFLCSTCIRFMSKSNQASASDLWHWIHSWTRFTFTGVMTSLASIAGGNRFTNGFGSFGIGSVIGVILVPKQEESSIGSRQITKRIQSLLILCILSVP